MKSGSFWFFSVASLLVWGIEYWQESHGSRWWPSHTAVGICVLLVILYWLFSSWGLSETDSEKQVEAGESAYVFGYTQTLLGVLTTILAHADALDKVPAGLVALKLITSIVGLALMLYSRAQAFHVSEPADVMGVQVQQLTQKFAAVGQTLDSLNDRLTKMNSELLPKLAEVVQDIKSTAGVMKEAADKLAALPTTLNKIAEAQPRLAQAITALVEKSAALPEMVAKFERGLDGIQARIQQLDEAVGGFAHTVQKQLDPAANQTAEDLKGLRADLDNLREQVRQANDALKNFKQVAPVREELQNTVAKAQRAAATLDKVATGLDENLGATLSKHTTEITTQLETVRATAEAQGELLSRWLGRLSQQLDELRKRLEPPAARPSPYGGRPLARAGNHQTGAYQVPQAAETPKPQASVLRQVQTPAAARPEEQPSAHPPPRATSPAVGQGGTDMKPRPLPAAQPTVTGRIADWAHGWWRKIRRE